jgi:phosphomannomutase
VAVDVRPVADAVRGVLDRAAAPDFARLGKRAVSGVRDYRRATDASPPWLSAAPLVELGLEGGRVLLRPSGTEPKLKLYVDLRAEPTSGSSLAALESELTREAGELMRELVEKLGLLSENAAP